jgi:hypothetical protein
MRESRWRSATRDADFAPYLAGMPDPSVDLFWRFVAMARSCGPVTFELQRTSVVLCGTRRIFGSVAATKTGLTGHLNLTRRLEDPRVRKVDPLTKTLFMHRYLVGSIAELDEEFGRWLCEARRIGDGQK